MAERRMFAKSIIDSDLFLDMPSSTQNLYFHLAMRADDDGFVNAPFKIMRMVSCSKNDMDLLIAKQFIIPFESGVCVIKHWRIHNYIQSDRYKPTMYRDEKSQLIIESNKSYAKESRLIKPLSNLDTERIHNVSTLETQVRLGKDRLVEDRKDIGPSDDRPARSKFVPPSLEDVQAYCRERQNSVDPQKWIDHYTSNGWIVGRTKMKDWKASVRTWERSEYSKGGAKNAVHGRSVEDPYAGIDFGF